VVAVKRMIVGLTVWSIMLLGGTFSLLPSLGTQSPSSTAGPRTGVQGRVARALGNLPLSFEPNTGQADPAVRFLSRTRGSTLSLLESGNTQVGAALHGRPVLPVSSGRDVVEMSFLGTNSGAQVVGIDRLPGLSNYFIGNDASRWLTGIPRYARVIYRNLYPGIDLSFYGNQSGSLEYDLSLAPGVDPSIIELRIQGPHGMTLDPQGDLVLPLGERTILQPAPRIYQEVRGTRLSVAGHYVAQGDEVTFAVGAFDRSRPLIIDPEIEYSTFLGGSGDDLGDNHPAVDRNGNVYICGNTDSTDFPITGGAYQTENKGGFDAFVTEMNADGSGLIYSTYLGGTGTDLGIVCDLDHGGDLYLAGSTDSVDFPVTDGVVQPAFGGSSDGYVAKLSPGGSALLYSTYVGGSGDEELTGLRVDRSGHAFAAGDSSSTDFPTTPGAFRTSNAGGKATVCGSPCDEVVVKLDPTASQFVYSTYLGGPGDECCQPGIAIDAQGSAYVDGVTASRRFPTTPGAFQRYPAGGGTDDFVTKLDPTGSRLSYSTYLGGTGPELFAFGIAIGTSGAAYLAGATCSVDFPVTPRAFQKKNGGNGPSCNQSITDDLADGFVTALDPLGSALIFSTYLGGRGIDYTLIGPRIEPHGEVPIISETTSTDFPVTLDAFQRTNHGGANRFDGGITELTSDGSGLVFSTYWGGSGDDGLIGSVLDASGDLYVTGCTASSDFRTTKGAFQRTFAGGDGTGFGACYGSPADAFVTKVAFDEGKNQAKSVQRGPIGGSQAELGPTGLGGRWFWSGR
jgi:hypothetical protein